VSWWPLISPEREALYRRAPFPLYGLPPSFQGRRALGESATTEEDGQETIEYLGLSHGSHEDDDQPHIDVITATPEGAPDALDVLAAEAAVVLVPTDGAGEMIQALVDAQGPVQRIARQLLVDGQITGGERLRGRPVLGSPGSRGRPGRNARGQQLPEQGRRPRPGEEPRRIR
jgi:hypothetical protein